MKWIATIFVVSMREGEPNAEFGNVPASDIRLRSAAGSPVSLADFRGKVLVLSVLSPADAQRPDETRRIEVRPSKGDMPCNVNT